MSQRPPQPPAMIAFQSGVVNSTGTPSRLPISLATSMSKPWYVPSGMSSDCGGYLGSVDTTSFFALVTLSSSVADPLEPEQAATEPITSAMTASANRRPRTDIHSSFAEACQELRGTPGWAALCAAAAILCRSSPVHRNGTVSRLRRLAGEQAPERVRVEHPHAERLGLLE